MSCFEDCPTKRGYDVCTCDMMGEDEVIIEWEIKRMEGKLPWYNFIAHLTLAVFGPPAITKK